MTVPNWPISHKNLQDLINQASAIVNHFYGSMATCSNNAVELVERFKSIMHHTFHKHHFPFWHFIKGVHEKSTHVIKIEIKSSRLQDLINGCK